MARTGKIENQLSIKGVETASKAVSSAKKALKGLSDELDATKKATEEANETSDSWLDSMGSASFVFNEISDAAGKVGGAFLSVIDVMGDAVGHTQLLVSAFGDLDTAYETAARTGYAFSMEGLAKGMNMLKAAHVPIELTADQLEKIGNLAESMGVDGNEGLTKFAEAIAKGETASLEALGIFIKSEDVVAEYAKKHNIAAGALDTHAKKMIIAKAALKELDSAQVDVSESADSWGKATNKLDAAWSRFKSAVIAPLAGAAADVLDFFTGGSSDVAQTDAAAIKLGNTLKSHIASLRSINNLLDDRIEKTKSAKNEELALRRAALQDGPQTYESITIGVEERINTARTALEKWDTQVKATSDALKRAGVALKKDYTDPLDNMSDRVGGLVGQLEGEFKLGALKFEDTWLNDFLVNLQDAPPKMQAMLDQVGDKAILTRESFVQFFGGTVKDWQFFQRMLVTIGEDTAVPLGKLDAVMAKMRARQQRSHRFMDGGWQPSKAYSEMAASIKEVSEWWVKTRFEVHATVTGMAGLDKAGQKLRGTVKDTAKSLEQQKKTQSAAQRAMDVALNRELHIRRAIQKVVSATMTSSLGVITKMQAWLKRSDVSLKGISRAKILNNLARARFEIEKVIAQIGIHRDREAIRAQIKLLKTRQKSLKMTLAQANLEALRAGKWEKASAMWAGKAGQELRSTFKVISQSQAALGHLSKFEKILAASRYKRPASTKKAKGPGALPSAIDEKFIKQQQLERLKASTALTHQDKKRIILLEFQIKQLTILAQKEKELLMVKKAGAKHAHLAADVRRRASHLLYTADLQRTEALKKLESERWKSFESGLKKMNESSEALRKKLKDEEEREKAKRLEALKSFNDMMVTMSQDFNTRLAEAHGMTVEDADGVTQKVLSNTERGILRAAAAMQSIGVLTKKLIDQNGKLQDGMITALGASLSAFFEHEHERSAFMAGMVMLDAIAATIRTQNYAYLALGAAAAAGYGALAGVQYSAHKKEAAAKARAEQMKAASVKPIKAAGGTAMGGAITYVFNAPVIGGSAQEIGAQMSSMQNDGAGSGFAGGGI